MNAKTYCLVCKKITYNDHSKTVKNKERLIMKAMWK